MRARIFRGWGLALDYVGAVWRSLKAILSDRPSVKSFGAVGDGVTDDTAAFTAALAAAPRLYVPKPSVKYLVSGALNATVTRDIEGDGAAASVIESNDNTEDILVFPDDADHMRVAGLGLRFTAKGAGNGLVLTRANHNALIERVNVINAAVGFFSKNVSWLQRYSQCRADDCDTGFKAEGRDTDLSGGGTTMVYDQCFANRCETGFHTVAISEVLFLLPALQFEATLAAPKGIFAELCTLVQIKQLSLEGTVAADGYGVRVQNSTLDVLSIDGAKVDVTATGFDFYLYSVSNAGGDGKVEVRNVSGRLATDVKEYLMQNDAGGVITINKFGNDFTAGISGTDISLVAGTLTERNFDGTSLLGAKGVANVAAGGNLDTTLGAMPAVVLTHVKPGSDALPTVMSHVTDMFSDGNAKIRYSKLSDGTADFTAQDVFWIAFK